MIGSLDASPRLARPRPAHALRLALGWAALLVAAGFVLFWRLHDSVGVYDEGVVLHGAEIVLHGGVPYRDMWTVYAPGQLYVVAAVFRLFGASVLSERLADLAFRLVLALVLYGLLARLVGRRYALAAWLLLVLKLGYTGEFGYSVFPAFSSALLSGCAVLRWSTTARRRWLAVAGAGAAACTLFRQDFGVYALLLDVTLVALLILATPGARALPRRTLLRRGAEPAALLLLTTTVILAPAVLYLVATAGISTLRYDLFTFPTTTLRAMRALPPPPPDLGLLPLPGRAAADLSAAVQLRWMEFYLPLAVYAASSVLLVRAWRRDGPPARDCGRFWLRALLLGLGILLFSQALSRDDEAHTLPTVLSASLLATDLFQQAHACARRLPRRLLLYVALSWIVLLYVAQPVAELAHAAPYAAARCESAVPRAACVALDPDQLRAIRFVQQIIPADAAIFVGNVRHDAVSLNDVAFYFLADRRSPTRYSVFDPGVITTARVQQAVVNDISRAGVKVVVLVDAPLRPEPNGSARSSGVTILDQALRETFRPVFASGPYSIWQKQ